MDAGRPSQTLFSIPYGSAPVTYGSNGQLQMSPGGSSVQLGDTSLGDTDSSGKGPSDQSSATPQESETVTEQQATQSPAILDPPLQSLPYKATPSPNLVPKLSVTTTTTGSIQVSTSSLRSSLQLFGISTMSTFSLPLPSSQSVSLGFTQSRSTSVSGFHSAPRSSSCADYPGTPCSKSANSPVGSSTTSAGFRTVSPLIPVQMSNFGARSSSWYLGVIFGTIAGVGLLVFCVGAIVFSCRKAKRRRMAHNIDIPWAVRPDEGDGQLFFSPVNRRTTSHGVNAAGRRDLDHRRSPTSGREPGVPSRTAGFSTNRPRCSLRDHPIPDSRLFFDDPRSEDPTLGRLPNTLRFLPSHLIDEELFARTVQEDGGYSHGSGRPRKLGHVAVDVNPYINRPVDSLNLIRNNISSVPPTNQPLVDRLRNLDKDHSGFWDRLPTPGRDQPKEDIEPWAASFKANLFNAFNAFAFGLKPYESSGKLESDNDKLTQLPTRHQLSNRSSSLQPYSCGASTKSPGWILHEKNDGTGTVQFLPTLEKRFSCSTPAPGKFVALRSSGRGGICDAGEEGTEKLHTEKDTPALMKPNPISRDSSLYSTSSLATSKCGSLTTSLDGRLADVQNVNPRVDVVVLEPFHIASISE